MTTNPLARLSVQQLRRAVVIRQKIAKLESQLGRFPGAEGAPSAARPKKRRLSAAAKAKISAAAKARWKKFRAQKAKK